MISSLSYGTAFGDYGYINYVRGDKSLENCGFFNSAFKLFATYRRGKDQGNVLVPTVLFHYLDHDC